MSFILKEFQEDAKNQLLTFMDTSKKEAVLRSPTGSGKTIILTSFIEQFCRQNTGYFAKGRRVYTRTPYGG